MTLWLCVVENGEVRPDLTGCIICEAGEDGTSHTHTYGDIEIEMKSEMKVKYIIHLFICS